jgi:hypothetical protein
MNERTVGRSLSGRLDDFGRRHPRLMLLAVMVLASLVTVLLLAKSEGPVVLYQRF